MEAWEAALWGLFGGFAVEGLEFAAAVRRVKTWPWAFPGEPRKWPYFVSVVIRLTISSGLPAAATASDQISTVFAAVAFGIAAPLVVEQIARQAPALVGDVRPEPTVVQLPAKGESSADEPRSGPSHAS